MAQYCYVIINNAGHSWAANASLSKDANVPVLPQLLQDGWTPVRETPMGGGTSSLAHSLILLEKAAPKARTGRGAKAASPRVAADA
jgi:hypothetical protein